MTKQEWQQKIDEALADYVHVRIDIGEDFRNYLEFDASREAARKLFAGINAWRSHYSEEGVVHIGNAGSVDILECTRIFRIRVKKKTFNIGFYDLNQADAEINNIRTYALTPEEVKFSENYELP